MNIVENKKSHSLRTQKKKKNKTWNIIEDQVVKYWFIDKFVNLRNWNLERVKSLQFQALDLALYNSFVAVL